MKFKLAIPFPGLERDSIKKYLIPLWKRELSSLRNLKPVVLGQERIWITDFVESDLHLEARSPSFSESIVVLDFAAGQDSVIVNGECADFLDNFINGEIERIKELYQIK